MSDKVQQVKDGMGLFQKVASYVPGYRGYKEKEVRRETDRLVRATASGLMAKALDEYRRPLMYLSLPAPDRDSADSIMARLDTVRERTARAVSGYAGIFDAVKVEEPTLDKMVELDASLVEAAQSLYNSCKAIDVPSPTVEGFREGSAAVLDGIQKVEGILEQRESLLKNP
ncbi:MAG TPA: hypothetical protein VMS77_09790 [Conexivisphaerales archaeon]|nr:hypothetical protein [Conexivisphaerales archaeon]